MKKIFQKNQIAITALAIMIAVAGYLNFTEQNTSSDGTKKQPVPWKQLIRWIFQMEIP